MSGATEDGLPDGLFEQVLRAPDRDRLPGEPDVVSFRDDDEPAFLTEIERRARTRVSLVRRGIWHGNWAEIEGQDRDADADVPRPARLAERWHTARPIVLRALADPRSDFDDEIAAKRRLHDELKEPGGLRRFLKRRRAELEPQFALQHRLLALTDAERDIERVQLGWTLDPEDPRGPRMKDLWVKSGWLSTHDEDDSLRMRVSCGREGADDAQRDVRRHRRVAELAAALFPEADVVHSDARLLPLLEELVGSEVFLTQHIAYWNGPSGGALFHHDAFAEPVPGGQRGVVYVQLSGSTAWLALSIEDLTRRVIEIGEYLAEGELPWVKDQLFRDEASWARFRRMLPRFRRVARELSRPGCGSLGRLVNRGPEFTSLLADAGHAFLLGPGDAIVLPNHGYDRTAMHSVFCASDEPAYGLSMAIRESHPPEIILPPTEEGDGRAPDRRRRSRR